MHVYLSMYLPIYLSIWPSTCTIWKGDAFLVNMKCSTNKACVHLLYASQKHGFGTPFIISTIYLSIFSYDHLHASFGKESFSCIRQTWSGACFTWYGVVCHMLVSASFEDIIIGGWKVILNQVSWISFLFLRFIYHVSFVHNIRSHMLWSANKITKGTHWYIDNNCPIFPINKAAFLTWQIQFTQIIHHRHHHHRHHHTYQEECILHHLYMLGAAWWWWYTYCLPSCFDIWIWNFSSTDHLNDGKFSAACKILRRMWVTILKGNF